MKALTFQGNQQIAYTQANDPSILQATDAIVKVDITAICGSDLHVYHEREKGLDTGTIMGHEFVGEIVAIGQAVQLLKVGDKVVSPFSTNCGSCYYCKKGLTARCLQGQLFGWVENGKGLHGAQAEYVRVPFADACLVKYPASLKAEIALLSGDILSTAYYCAEQAEVKAGETYAVVGCGPVGLMAIQAAFMQGAEVVYAIDSVAARLQLAASYGAIPINRSVLDPVEKIRSLTQNLGVDAVLEAVGNASAARLAYELVQLGGIISTVGVHTAPHFAFSPAEAYDKNITYKVGRCSARHYMKRLLPKLVEQDLNLQAIFTHRLKLCEGVQAYDLFDKKAGNCIKILLHP